MYSLYSLYTFYSLYILFTLYSMYHHKVANSDMIHLVPHLMIHWLAGDVSSRGWEDLCKVKEEIILLTFYENILKSFYFCFYRKLPTA